MIDFSAIEAELKTALSSVTTFKSIECGRIRETVATAQMPSLDISCQGHTYKREDPEAAYKSPALLVIRRMGFDRSADADAFKVLIEQICNILESTHGTAFNVIRGISSQIQEGDSGNGSVIRAGVIQITLWA
jgi:hypothetical protein